MRWGVTGRRPHPQTPLPQPPRGPAPDGAEDRPRDAEPFDLRRRRDVLTLAFLAIGMAPVLAVYIARPVLHPWHLTVPLAFLLIVAMAFRATSP
jgi:hypothetical protein